MQNTLCDTNNNSDKNKMHKYSPLSKQARVPEKNRSGLDYKKNTNFKSNIRTQKKYGITTKLIKESIKFTD